MGNSKNWAKVLYDSAKIIGTKKTDGTKDYADFKKKLVSLELSTDEQKKFNEMFGDNGGCG